MRSYPIPSFRALLMTGLIFISSGCDKINPLSSGSFGSGTPDPERNRGIALNTLEIGDYRIEVRQYLAGKGSTSANFCDYWVTFQDKPIDSLPYLNSYNSCGALLVLDKPGHPFVIGAYAGSGGEYVPIFFSQNNNHPYVNPRPECALRSGQHGHSQAWQGWSVQDGYVELCGDRWKVLQSSSDSR